jgi:prepilin-type N-terminal cleavage/methylation domain-containing protein
MYSCSEKRAGKRHPRQRSSRRSAGFTLIEISIVVAIVALIAAMSASMGGSMIESARRVNTTNKLDAIEAALLSFRLANNRIPCPTDPALTDIPANTATFGQETGTAGTCGGGSNITYTVPSGVLTAPSGTTVVEGAVPVKALNLPDEFQIDGWGRKFAYAVWVPMTAAATSPDSPAGFINFGITPSCGAIIVENAGHGNRTTSGIYALVSYGPDGHGGYTKSATTRYNVGVSMTNVDEIANAHYDSSGTDTGYLATYIEKEYGQYPSDNDSLHPFGDYVRFKERWQMQDDYDRYQPAGATDANGTPGTMLAVGWGYPAGIKIYAKNCGKWNAMPDSVFDVYPTDGVYSLSWSRDNQYLGMGGNWGCSVYKYANGSFTQLAFSNSCPERSSPVFSPDGTHLAVVGIAEPYVTFYKRAGDNFNVIAGQPDVVPPNPSAPGTGCWAGCYGYTILAVYSPNSNYFAAQWGPNTFPCSVETFLTGSGQEHEVVGQHAE